MVSTPNPSLLPPPSLLPNPTSQASKAKKYWDTFYNTSAVATEWILKPSHPALLSIIMRTSSSPPSPPEPSNKFYIRSVLEIGCGDSKLGSEVYDLLVTRRQAEIDEYEFDKADLDPTLPILNDHPVYRPVKVLCVDISPSGIASCLSRDALKVSPLIPSPNKLDYKVTDVINDLHSTLSFLSPHHPSRLHPCFDIVLDKGCCDTFSFRAPSSSSSSSSSSSASSSSANSQSSKESTPYLLITLFTSLHTLLTPTTGRYIIISPRKKIKYLQDDGMGLGNPPLTYKFKCQRSCIDISEEIGVTLEGKGEKKERDLVYVWDCLRVAVAAGVRVGAGGDVKGDYEHEVCRKCLVRFESIKIFKPREKKNHECHCRGQVEETETVDAVGPTVATLKSETIATQQQQQQQQPPVTLTLLPSEWDFGADDPTAFWKDWSTMHKACVVDAKDGKGCVCFEGIGSVM